MTVLPALMAALTGPLWAMKLSYFVDNPWGVGLTKSRKAGLILADMLCSNAQSGRYVGLRPPSVKHFTRVADLTPLAP